MQLNELDKMVEEYIEKNDMVSIVRCKDCKHYKIMEQCFKKDGTPIYFCNSDYGLVAYLMENDFCSYGEKRKENEN